MQGQDVNAIRQAADELGQTIQKIGGSMYQQPEGQPGEAGESGPQPDEGGSSGEDVVEGDFKEG